MRERIFKARTVIFGAATVRERIPSRHRGVTLLEMVIVMAIAGLIASISYPALATGLDTFRLNQASGDLSTFLNGAMNRAERRQQAVALTILPRDGAIWMHTVEPGFARKLAMPAGVRVAGVQPKLPVETDDPRRFLLIPGATFPRLAVELVNQRGSRRTVTIDPLTGVPQIERP